MLLCYLNGERTEREIMYTQQQMSFRVTGQRDTYAATKKLLWAHRANKTLTTLQQRARGIRL